MVGIALTELETFSFVLVYRKEEILQRCQHCPRRRFGLSQSNQTCFLILVCCHCDNIRLIYPGGVYEVHLDRRKLKTPGGKLFTVPNEALAVAVATEWDAQKETLKYYSMHLVSLLTLRSRPTSLPEC